jgi:hypothetical protein
VAILPIFKLLAEGNGGFADASKGNEDKNDRKCYLSLEMLGRYGNIMDGEYSPSLRCSRRWKYSGWGTLPITLAILLPKVAL